MVIKVHNLQKWQAWKTIKKNLIQPNTSQLVEILTNLGTLLIKSELRRKNGIL